MSAQEIIRLMQQAAPPGKYGLSDAQDSKLRLLTSELASAVPNAAEERARFWSIKDRSLSLPEIELDERLSGKTILVTGGTGCIGSTLLGLLQKYYPARLVSVSRCVSKTWQIHSKVDYLPADISNRPFLLELIRAVQPDVIFHCAAQRSPGLAEIQVERTIMTNIFGTKNLLEAALEAGVPQVVCASTGKALRPYSPDVYAATKRAAECIAAATATSSDMLVSACRFTHVVDNSIIGQNLKHWTSGTSTVIRLHSPDIAFYVQSAKESAQLLLTAFLGAKRHELRIHAITDLGWPVSLLDLAIGERKHRQSHVPIYFSGFDAGYEETAYPGLYDPETAGDISPLLNMFEAASVGDAPCAGIDAFRLDIATTWHRLSPLPVDSLDLLSQLLDSYRYERTKSEVSMRNGLEILSWGLLAATFQVVPKKLLARSVKLASQHKLTSDHEQIVALAKSYASIPAIQVHS